VTVHAVVTDVVAPEIGKRYRLRNGAQVEILRRQQFFTLGNPDIGQAFVIGRYLGCEDRCSWESTGHYAPECGRRPHELDIIEKIP
jgi:hypothetical protein